jgi:hypothetical protein
MASPPSYSFVYQNQDRSSLAIKIEGGETKIVYAESHALVIGVSRYNESSGWRPLPGVLEDVKAVQSALEEQSFKVETLIDPTHDALDAKIEAFIAEHGNDEKVNNRLLIYFAGHGATVKTADNKRILGYIVPVDAPSQAMKTAFKLKAIDMVRMEEYASKIESKHAMFVFDSCFSGSLFRSMEASTQTSIDRNTQEPVRQFITAGSDTQSVPDRSIFRSLFIRALRGEADLNKDRYVTGTELGLFLQYRVHLITKGKQTPIFGTMRAGELDKGDLVFQPRAADVATNIISVADLLKELKEIDPDKHNAMDRRELSYWLSITNSKDPAVFGEYLERYPTGTFAEVARKKLQKLQPHPASEPSGSRSASGGFDGRNGEWYFAPVSFRVQNKAPAQSATPAPPASGDLAVKPDPQHSWFVILGSFALDQQDRANALLVKHQAQGYDAQLINTNWGPFPNFARGLWVVVIGPSTQREARKLAREIQSTNLYRSRKEQPYFKQAVRF